MASSVDDVKTLKKQAKKLLKNFGGMDRKVTHIFMYERRLTAIPVAKSSHATHAYYHNNAIEKIDNLNMMQKLQHLHLQNNKISKIENLSGLVCLRKLFLGGNCISVVENLMGLRSLEELYLENQELSSSEELCFEPRCLVDISATLRILDVSNNNITHLRWIKPLRHLRVLFAKNNNLTSYQDAVDDLCILLQLYNINFIGNPMAKKHRYKETLVARCPSLRVIDDTPISHVSKVFLQKFDEVRKLRSVKSINNENNVTYKEIDGDYDITLLSGPHTQNVSLSDPKRTVPPGFRAFNSSYTLVHNHPHRKIKLTSSNEGKQLFTTNEEFQQILQEFENRNTTATVEEKEKTVGQREF